MKQIQEDDFDLMDIDTIICSDDIQKQILQNQKLRELIEKFFNGDNVMVKKEYKELLEESKA